MANYPVPYQNTWGYSGIGQQMYPQYQIPTTQTQTNNTQQTAHGLIWVDGEVGAKAYQMPNGWPANQPIALWDTNDTVIYLKSINAMGMPNPLQKAHYTLEEHKSSNPMSSRSGDAIPAENVHDMSEYVKKSDLEKMKQELIDTIGTMGTSGTGVRRTAKGDS